MVEVTDQLPATLSPLTKLWLWATSRLVLITYWKMPIMDFLTCIIVKSVENYKNGISADLFVFLLGVFYRCCPLFNNIHLFNKAGKKTSWNFWNISEIFHEIFQGKKNHEILRHYLPQTTIAPFQRVQNAAACWVQGSTSLHVFSNCIGCLFAGASIQTVLHYVFSFQTNCPAYLSDIVQTVSVSRLRLRFRSSSSTD